MLILYSLFFKDSSEVMSFKDSSEVMSTLPTAGQQGLKS
jgi:hypothetical protein